MKVLFRADASVDIGSGHLMRCLTLADQLRNEGAEVAFVCRDLPGAMFELLQVRKYQNARLLFAETSNFSLSIDANETIEAAAILFPYGLDWLVVDHYALDAIWELILRPHVKKIMVIDDLADRHHDCDLLLDQNLYENMQKRYDGLVPIECTKLIGPLYSLVRPEFLEVRRALVERDGIVSRILVFFGGSDPSNETAKTLQALLMLNLSDISLEVVVGGSNPHKIEIEDLCQMFSNASYHCQVDNMAVLMAKADLAIGGGGSTTWERCIMELPTLVMALAENQIAIAKATHQANAVIYLGEASQISCAQLAGHIQTVINAPFLLRNMSQNSGKLVDGNGSLRIAKVMRS